jgi:large subunit ribosomal protein L15
MTLTDLKSNANKKRKRVGRGNASGHGTYSCRGMNGQSARTGGRRRPGFEGGQTPYLRRIPKLKGFRNPNTVDYQVVNLGDLNQFDEKTEITAEILCEQNLIAKSSRPVKLLAGKGKLEKKIKISVNRVSASALEAVKALKGSVTLIETPKEKLKAEAAKAKAKKAEK